uniref:Mucin like 3 n=1 Tax=Otolemur garnettii TaxID=30611 RepID=H0Y0D0_OTOGA
MKLAHSLSSTFGLQCCLLFLLASWEAGATTFQEWQEAGKSPTSDHSFPLTFSPVYGSPSVHIVLHSGQRLPDLPKSTETQKLKHHCNSTHHSKPMHKPKDNSKVTDQKRSTVDHEAPSTSKQNSSNQGKEPIIRNERSVNSVDFTTTHKESSDKKHLTPDPKRKTCRSTTRDSNKTTRPLEKTTITLGNKTNTSHETTLPFHTSDNSGSNKTPTSSSEKNTAATKTTYKAIRTPQKSEKPDDYRTTVASDTLQIKTTKYIKDTMSATNEKTTSFSANPTQHGDKTTLANEKTTPSPETPMEHPEKSTSVHLKKTTLSLWKTTPVLTKPTENLEKTTLASETIQISVKSTDNQEKTAAVTKTIRPPVKVTGDKSITTASPSLNKTKVTHLVPIGSFTITASRKELSSMMSEAIGNKNHQNQNKAGSQAGLHPGQMGENDSFPAWAIVIVILVAVILLLVFLGLIFLVSYMMRTRRALTQNTQDNDPEDEGGPNSYPVYLMEQQTLGMGQIPSPR